MSRLPRLLSFLALALLSAGVASCGGSGGGDPVGTSVTPVETSASIPVIQLLHPTAVLLGRVGAREGRGDAPG